MLKDLGDGVQMPVLGLGVWQMDEGAETENAVEWALEAGYRNIDTAQLYRNERSVGAAIQRSGLPREEIFVTTKWLPTMRSAGSALEQSLERGAGICGGSGDRRGAIGSSRTIPGRTSIIRRMATNRRWLGVLQLQRL